MKKIFFFLILCVLLVSLIGCTGQETMPPETEQKTTPPEKVPELEEMEEEMDIKVTERGVKYIVDPNKLVGGGPPKDGIPSIDNPKYVSVEEADQWIQDNELVLAIIYKGVKRVYPLQIMVWHEIVNDTIADDPILITY
jgi:hypothetical protein